MRLAWSTQRPHFINSVAISDDGQRVVAGTYFFPYPVRKGTQPFPKKTRGTYGTYCFDAAGQELWRDEYEGNEGIYGVAVSGNGEVAAAGGLLSGGKFPDLPTSPRQCLVRAFAADGTRLLDYSGMPTRVNYVALDREATVLAAVTIDGELLVFAREGSGFAAAPQIPVSDARLDMVAVHPGGEWLVAAGWESTVHFVTLDKGTVTGVFTWKGPDAKLELLTCAIATRADRFVAGGHNLLFLFTKDSMTAAGGAGFVSRLETPRGGTARDLRWAAMSADGTLVTVVQNLGNDLAGMLLTYACDGKQLTELRPPFVLGHNPNSTSLDAAGRFISVADGHPVRAPGTFYLFRASDGAKVMAHETPDMNWPMVLAADGSAAVAGSDDLTGPNIFYFAP